MASTAVQGEKKASDLTSFRRWMILILVSVGSSTIYGPAYIKYAFPDPLREALGLTNVGTANLLQLYAITATASYLFAGLLADRIRMRTLSSVGFISTAALTYVYAMIPSYTLLQVIFVLMGITTILIWWGVRYKLVRLVSDEDKYSRNIGLSYGFYGAAGLLFSLIATWIFGQFASKQGLTILLICYGTVILALGILSLIYIPKFEGERNPTASAKEVVVSALKSLANPVVLITAVAMFFVYLFYTSTSYTATYMGELGADQNLTNLVSSFRQYGVTLLAAPVFGALAAKAKRASVPIWIGSGLAAAGFVVLAIMPAGESIIPVVLVLALALGFIANGVFGIVSAMLTEGRVTLATFGAATGVVSLVGFLPDTVTGPWLSGLADDNEYPTMFWVLAAAAVVAALCALVLVAYVKANKTKLDEAYAAAEIEAAKAAGDDEASALVTADVEDAPTAEQPADDEAGATDTKES